MTRQEMKKRLEELEERRFMLNMVDRWSRKHYELDSELRKEISELEKKLN